ncbi:unnamed protein product [Fraxinus pennsylvanica]|uniref:Uncharacterized protein n=1 Tax=Fraxinus pennsylvanica TaxID=56036 RepID=A0AAD1YX21_9LAMI|nr:unnamed protein product [Fraxinus pennsylvanica]
MAFTDAEKQKSFDKEINELISSLTNCVSSIPKNGGDSTQDDDGFRMITLSGTNLGANMRGEMDEKPTGPQGVELGDTEELTAYVNNNFQASNNSIMLGGSFNTKDPGVHLDISEYVDHNAHHLKRGKKGEKGGSESDHHNEHYSD